MNEPKIRLKGFSGEWKETRVSEVLEIRDIKAPKNADFPLKAFIANQGIVDKGEKYDRSALITDVENKPYKRTMFNDFIYSSNNLESGSIGLNKYGNASISPVYSIFKCKEGFDPDFIGRRFVKKDFIHEMVKWRQGVMYGQWRIHEKDFLQIEVNLPLFEEQQSIGKYFEALDSLIQSTTKKIESLKQVKAASLQSMFPQEGETTPRVRFKGFQGEWEKVRASNVFKTFNEKNRPDLPVLSATQDRGMVTREAIGYNIFHNKSNEATYKHILPGQFIIHLRSFQGGFAHSAIEGIASPAYTIMEFKDKTRHFDLYWKYIFMSKEFIKRLELITYGIRDGRSISFEEFSEMYFTVPSYDEQQKIADYFTNLDSQITLQTHRLEKLKQIKSACLDNMFV